MTMANFAIHDGLTVVNVIVAETAEIAEQVTGMSAFETDGHPWIGWTFVDGVWTAPAQPESEVTDEPSA